MRWRVTCTWRQRCRDGKESLLDGAHEVPFDQRRRQSGFPTTGASSAITASHGSRDSRDSHDGLILQAYHIIEQPSASWKLRAMSSPPGRSVQTIRVSANDDNDKQRQPRSAFPGPYWRQGLNSV